MRDLRRFGAGSGLGRIGNAAPSARRLALVWLMVSLLLTLAVLSAPLTFGQSPDGAPTAVTAPTPVMTQVRQADGMVMVYVLAGDLTMGSTDAQVEQAYQLCRNHDSNCPRNIFEVEGPAHPVALDGFWIDRTEVTNAQYQRCVEAGKCAPSEYKDDARFNGGDQPVVGALWSDADGYCRWAGARLPSEAEWEYAARGPESRLYPWGSEWDASKANVKGLFQTAPVGSYPAGTSWAGALDLAGNAWEWVADWYGPYPSGRQVNPTGPASGEYRVLRGGSFDVEPYYARGTYRLKEGTNFKYSNYGFRCAKSS